MFSVVFLRSHFGTTKTKGLPLVPPRRGICGKVPPGTYDVWDTPSAWLALLLYSRARQHWVLGPSTATISNPAATHTTVIGQRLSVYLSSRRPLHGISVTKPHCPITDNLSLRSHCITHITPRQTAQSSAVSLSTPSPPVPRLGLCHQFPSQVPRLPNNIVVTRMSHKGQG